MDNFLYNLPKFTKIHVVHGPSGNWISYAKRIVIRSSAVSATYAGVHEGERLETSAEVHELWYERLLLIGVLSPTVGLFRKGSTYLLIEKPSTVES